MNALFKDTGVTVAKLPPLLVDPVGLKDGGGEHYFCG